MDKPSKEQQHKILSWEKDDSCSPTLSAYDLIRLLQEAKTYQPRQRRISHGVYIAVCLVLIVLILFFGFVFD